MTLGGQEEALTKRRQLAADLRRLRDQSGMSGRKLAQKIGISQSKLSRIESGATIPTLPVVAAWAKALRAPAETRDRLAATTEAAFTEVQPWHALRSRTSAQDTIQEREASARSVRVFQPLVVPGLLQTAGYARRVFSLIQAPNAKEDAEDTAEDNAEDNKDIAAAVAARLHRQVALYEEDREFGFLITEAALRWRPGPVPLLLAQIDRIASVSTLENVSIGLIPLAREAVAPMSHGFVIYDGYADGRDPFVAVETIHADLTTDDPADVALYERRWSLLQRMAVVGEEAQAFLTTLSREIRSSTG